MGTRQPIFLAAAALGLVFLLVLIIFGDKGLVDLHYLKAERNRLQAANRELVLQNHALYQQKLRLEKGDPALIEHVARKELGFVGPEELVLIRPASRKAATDTAETKNNLPGTSP